jgi:hypothetical protein
VAKRALRQPHGKKVVDETIMLKRPRRGANINRLVCQADNGRVLGYDNSHDFHHRHFMGRVEAIKFKDYATLASRFRDEVQELWRKEDEKNS